MARSSQACTATSSAAQFGSVIKKAPSRVVPQVLGPTAIPVLTNAGAGSPELAVLCALAHVHDDGPFEVLDALAVALDDAPVDHAVEHARRVLAALPEPDRRHLEELMAADTFEYQSDFTRALEARGEVKGRAAMVLHILAARGVEVSDEIRDRILTCTDFAQLEAWGVRAVTAVSGEDFLA